MKSLVFELEKIKQALRIKTDAFDEEIMDLIASALLDLGIAGVDVPHGWDPLINRAVITYCKMAFGLPEDYERLKESYDEQKAQLRTATGYTVWGDGDV